MGLSTAPAVAAGLIAAGRAPETPAAIVENASLPGERRRLTTLAGLAEAAAEALGPAVLIIGEAAALTEASPTACAVAPARAAS
jgi:siroheme synthase